MMADPNTLPAWAEQDYRHALAKLADDRDFVDDLIIRTVESHEREQRRKFQQWIPGADRSGIPTGKELEEWKRDGVKGVRRCAQQLMRTKAFDRLRELDHDGVRYTKRVGNYCEQIVRPLLELIPDDTKSGMLVGRLSHAMHTRDAKETMRLTVTLAGKGRL